MTGSHDRSIDITNETMQVWWRRFGQIFALEIRELNGGQFRIDEAIVVGLVPAIREMKLLDVARGRVLKAR